MDEFEELFGSVSTGTVAANAPSESTNDTAEPTGPAFTLDDDFDAMLNSITLPAHSNESDPTTIPASTPKAEVDSASTPTAQWTALEDKEQQEFLSWLDNDDIPTKTPTKSAAALDSSFVPIPSNISTVPELPGPRPVVDFDALLQSSFVDVEALRNACLESGSIPKSLRAQIWSYLLNGAFTPDAQADDWQYSADKVANSSALEADCDVISTQILEKFRDHGDYSLMTYLNNDLKDIISLYCARKNVPYRSIYTQALVPLLVPPCSMPRPQASACLYALCSYLFPILGLPKEVATLCVNKYHSWLRLLLGYHFPALLQHLDRVLPHWEEATDDVSVAVDKDAELARDQATSSPASVPEDATGILPTTWTCAFFAGCLPAAEVTQLWDWGIVQGNKYASLYLTVALFGIYSEALLGMAGPELKDWIRAITTGREDWYRMLPFNISGVGTEVSSQQFLQGWMDCASWIRTHSPNSFQSALEGLEEWGILAVQHHSPATVQNQTTQEAKDSDMSLTSIFQSISKISIRDLTTTPAHTSTPTVATSAPQPAASSGPSDTSNIRMCLWTTPQDVVSQLCAPTSGNRTQRTNWSFQESFVQAIGQTDHVYPPCNPICRLTTKVNVTQPSTVRYFGVDCRPRGYLPYGRFATSFHFDPSALTDPDAIANMLNTLEPLKGSVHLCLIGSGEGLIRRQYGNNPQMLQQVLQDARIQLNSMALFFIKRNFPFVSILQGGFTQAALYIADGKASHGLDTLVDADLPALGQAIGRNLGVANKVLPLDSLKDMFRLPPNAATNTTEMLDDIGEKFKSTFASFKKMSAASFKGTAVPRATEHTTLASQPGSSPTPPATASSPAFVIDSDEDEPSEATFSDAETKQSIEHVEDSTAIFVSKTEAEKNFALAQHRLSGLCKGDTLTITKENLPGSVLFPAIKYKYPDPDQPEALQLHRFLVVTPERLVVLDSGGEGVGSQALVKSNHHLTELLKMTFKKKDPDFVTLHYARGPGEPPKTNRYRISRKNEFVEILQRNTAKFR